MAGPAQIFRPPDSLVHGSLWEPEALTPQAGAVLVLGGSGGHEPGFLGEALAGEGLAALTLAYFGAPGLPDQLREIPLE